MLQNLKKKVKKSKISNFSHFRGTKCRVEANNNREAVVVCARHIVKRPSKRSGLVHIRVREFIDIFELKSLPKRENQFSGIFVAKRLNGPFLNF